MQVQMKQGVKYIRLNPGDHIAYAEQAVLSTLLGSCVSACLYDEHSRIIGMNHFMLPQQPPSRASNRSNELPGRFGEHAMDQLIEDMLQQGAQRQQLKAKIFGGASVIQNQLLDGSDAASISQRNCRFILDYLKARKIPIMASDLCGNSGRMIYFRSTDYAVFMRKVGTNEQA